MWVRMLCFARARELAGVQQAEIQLPENGDLEAFWAAVAVQWPRLAEERAAMRLAVDQEFAQAGQRLHDGAEVAVIPPVSGGAPTEAASAARAAVLAEPFASDEAARRLEVHPDRCGALSTFAGLVRAHSQGKRMVRLEYEAYEPMANASLARIVNEAEQRFEILQAAVLHRVGVLAVGEVAVSIAVAAAHRAPAFDACRYIIEEIKRDVPIWKREIAEDGCTYWGRGG